MSERKFYEDFEKYYADIPDCVCAGINGYKEVIEKIFDLTNGLLVLNKFEGIDNTDREYQLNLSINNKDYTFEFQGSDYFEQDLLESFNEIIENEYSNEKRRLIEFGDGMNFDFAIAFFERSKEYELVKSGKIWRREGWLTNYENSLK